MRFEDDEVQVVCIREDVDVSREYHCDIKRGLRVRSKIRSE